mmetsp:Transcript_2729/g.4079  ORF Transcript_2729/g.4079 Transcript_2729/m.4079 type:complete len:208 (+) Transcript_2729:114-737(+)
MFIFLWFWVGTAFLSNSARIKNHHGLKSSAKNDALDESPKDSIDKFTSSFQSDNRLQVNELILKLENSNQNLEPACSPQLFGSWELLFTSGSMPGMLVLQFISKIATQFNAVLSYEGLKLLIREEPFCSEAKVGIRILGRPTSISVSSKLQVESGVRIRENYQSAMISELPLVASLKLNRAFFITYIDDDILIVRDENGSIDLFVKN